MRREIARVNGVSEAVVPLKDGYRTFLLPKKINGTSTLEPGWLHVWPENHTLITGIPNADGSFCIILILPLEGEVSFNKLNTTEDYRRFFQEYYPRLLESHPEIPELVFARPLGSVRRVEAERWNIGSQYLLMGDAAHAMSYFFGQGTNIGLEDTRVFADLVRQSSLPQAIQTFASVRQEPVRRIQDASDRNQRVLAADAITPRFIFRRTLEREMVRRFPDYFRFKSEYESFSTLDLAEAYALIKMQEEILAELMQSAVYDLSAIDWNLAEILVKAKLRKK